MAWLLQCCHILLSTVVIDAIDRDLQHTLPHSKMSPWLGIAIVWLILSTTAAYQARATFELIRERKDKFTNPHCVKNADCLPSQCAQYFARCQTDSNCAVCVCEEQTPTFFEKRCMKDDDIIPQTGTSELLKSDMHG